MSPRSKNLEINDSKGIQEGYYKQLLYKKSSVKVRDQEKSVLNRFSTMIASDFPDFVFLHGAIIDFLKECQLIEESVHYVAKEFLKETLFDHLNPILEIKQYGNQKKRNQLILELLDQMLDSKNYFSLQIIGGRQGLEMDEYQLSDHALDVIENWDEVHSSINADDNKKKNNRGGFERDTDANLDEKVNTKKITSPITGELQLNELQTTNTPNPARANFFDHDTSLQGEENHVVEDSEHQVLPIFHSKTESPKTTYQSFQQAKYIHNFQNIREAFIDLIIQTEIQSNTKTLEKTLLKFQSQWKNLLKQYNVIPSESIYHQMYKNKIRGLSISEIPDKSALINFFEDLEHELIEIPIPKLK
jgi:hypothetical protein